MLNAELKNSVHWTWFLPMLSGGIVLGCLTYCRFWRNPVPVVLTDPDTSIICWLFCFTMNDSLFYLGVLFSSLSICCGILYRFSTKRPWWFLFITGLLLAPTGLLNFFPFYFARKYRVQ